MIVDTANVFNEAKDIVLTCSGIPAERLTRGTVFWDFPFTAEVDGVEANYNESVPVWLTGSLFRALGFREISAGKFDVDPPSAIGREIKCDIVHETVKDKVYARIKNPIPFADGSSKADEIPF